jgi:hypothetical protein
LVREDAALRQEVQKALGDYFPTRGELSELRALREDFNRFAKENHEKFETVLSELKTQKLHPSRLGNRIGFGLE